MREHGVDQGVEHLEDPRTKVWSDFVDEMQEHLSEVES